MQIDLFAQPFVPTATVAVVTKVPTPRVASIPVLPSGRTRDWRIKTPKHMMHAIWKEMRKRRYPWSALRDSILLLTKGETASEAQLEEEEALEIMRQLGIGPKAQ